VNPAAALRQQPPDEPALAPIRFTLPGPPLKHVVLLLLFCNLCAVATAALLLPPLTAARLCAFAPQILSHTVADKHPTTTTSALAHLSPLRVLLPPRRIHHPCRDKALPVNSFPPISVVSLPRLLMLPQRDMMLEARLLPPSHLLTRIATRPAPFVGYLPTRSASASAAASARMCTCRSAPPYRTSCRKPLLDKPQLLPPSQCPTTPTPPQAPHRGRLSGPHRPARWRAPLAFHRAPCVHMSI
jgi:hypothetical protein